MKNAFEVQVYEKFLVFFFFISWEVQGMKYGEHTFCLFFLCAYTLVTELVSSGIQLPILSLLQSVVSCYFYHLGWSYGICSWLSLSNRYYLVWMIFFVCFSIGLYHSITFWYTIFIAVFFLKYGSWYQQFLGTWYHPFLPVLHHQPVVDTWWGFLGLPVGFPNLAWLFSYLLSFINCLNDWKFYLISVAHLVKHYFRWPSHSYTIYTHSYYYIYNI